MANEIRFSTIHKSIGALPTINLPKFVVLTGRNGSGKTHFLEAINEGKVASSLVTNHMLDVLLFDWNSIIPQDTGIFNPHQYHTQQANWFTQIRKQQDQFFPSLQQQAMSLGIPQKYCSSLNKIVKLDKNDLTRILPDNQNIDIVYNNLKQQINQHGNNVYSNSLNSIGDKDWKKMAPEVLRENPSHFLESSESKFFNNNKFLWGQVDPFQQAFGKVFSTYRELIHQNDRLEKYPPERDIDLKYRDNEEFIDNYGEPPWDFVNHILEVCHLDFRVDGPLLHETTSYEPKLIKISSDIEMRFKDLSSGEKVLMSFALCLYNAQDNLQNIHFPKLLLLDEIDAPLHPSMVVSLLNTIQEVLIESKNVSVILTTHSPSTVALAPEESIYEMNANGPFISKISRSEALSILTMGVPTLSVSFDGRRQVFVESRTDARIYEKLYQLYKSDLDSKRSLVFIEVGRTNESSGAEHNSGCEQVKKIVNNLSDGGNISVFGLVDWDGERQNINRIHVLSHGIRDGIESLIFDPVLLFATIVRENIAFCRDKELIDELSTYTDLGSWNQEQWQIAVNKLQAIVIDNYSQKNTTIEIKYLNKMTLNISTNYLHLDDHDLESRIVDTFGFLRPKNNRAGGLMEHVFSSVISDYKMFIPQDLLVTFRRILEAEL